MTQTVEEIIARGYAEYQFGKGCPIDDLDREQARAAIEALTASGFAIVPVEPSGPGCPKCGREMTSGTGKDHGAWICHSCLIGKSKAASPGYQADEKGK